MCRQADLRARGRPRLAHWSASGLLLTTLVVFCLVVLATALGVRWNLSPSLPPGLYLLQRAKTPRVGDIALFCLREPVAILARSRGYIRSGRCAGRTAPLGKPVVAVSGAEIRDSAARVIIDGQIIPGAVRFSHDRAGRVMPYPYQGSGAGSNGSVGFRAGGASVLRADGRSEMGAGVGDLDTDSAGTDATHDGGIEGAYPNRVGVRASMLEDGEFWMLSTRHPRSFDSRYFGAVREADILGVLVPIWIWTPDPADSPGDP